MIVFKNKGVIDPKSITTFGVSSKENPGAIGFFGTGLKYAIAILLREGCKVTIYAGKRPLVFGVKQDKVRVDEFSVVTMNRRRLGFTTDVGKTWETWQAFRELYCNCIDEAGEAYQTDSQPIPEDDYTTVVVEGEKFDDVWAQRSDIILTTDPIECSPSVHIHPGASQYVYYRGIRAYRLDATAQYTYNLQLKTDLTEDRTIKYYWDILSAVRAGLCESKNTNIIKCAVTAPKGTYEHALDFDGLVPGDTFLTVVSELAHGFDPNLNQTALRAARLWAIDKIHPNDTTMKLCPVDQKRLDLAVAFCETLGFSVSTYPIIVSEFLGPDTLGLASDGKIYISKRTLMMGTKMLAGTLIEEYIHLKHKLYDNTRALQNFLIDTVVSLGERITGEPL